MRRALVLLSTALVLLAPVPAGAHAALVGTDPGDGAVLTAPDGSRVPLEVGARDRVVTARVVGDADQRGRWTLTYRVVSANGHPISGTSSFETTASRVVDQAAVVDVAQESFLHRHADRLWWAVGGGVGAVALIAWLLVRRRPLDVEERDA